MDKSIFDEKYLNIDITDYWLIIRKRFVHILLMFVLVFVAVLTYTYQQIPVYQSVCKIKISSRQPMATIEGAQITWYGASGNELNSEIKLIINKMEVLNSVVALLKDRSFKNHDNPDEEKKFYTKDELDEIGKLSFNEEEEKYIKKLDARKLQGLLTIEPVPRSDLVDLKMKGPYPQVSAAGANLLAMVYRADFWRSKIQEAATTKNFIKEQLDKVKTELAIESLKVEKTSEKNVFLGSEAVYTDELTNLRIQLNKLRERYKEDHPRIVKQKKEIAAIEKNLGKFPKTKQNYDDSLAEREAKQAIRKVLGEHFISAEINYEAKKEQAKDEIQIIAKARGASKLKPNVTMNVIAGALFGIILGCISAFVWEGLDTSIGKIEDVERITHLPVIAHIPVIGQKKSGNTFLKPVKIISRNLVKLFRLFWPQSPSERPVDFDQKIIFNFDALSVAAEAYRTLRTNIHFAIGSRKDSGSVIAITSTSPREGKTLTSTNLAIGLAQMGRMTLLIEADMRCPQIAKMFKIAETPGLSDILIGTATPDNSVRTITDILMGESEWEKLMETQGIDNLHLLPCGSIPPNPIELLISSEFKEMIEEFRKQYEFIIIDTPPTIPVSDSSVVGTVVDGTVLIYQSDTTSRHLLLRAIQTLKKNHAKLIGIVINQLSFDVIIHSNRSGYAYSYGNRK